MIFTETKLSGAFIIDPELVEDERGFFARTFCEKEFERHGIKFDFVQCNISFNKKRGTLRGIHYQAEPYAEAKLVRCTMGAIYDVIIDLRRGSSTFRKWVAVDLSGENRRMLYVPNGFAHGFQSLSDNSEVFYQMSEFYHQEAARAVRWDDPDINIIWPATPIVMSVSDASFAHLSAGSDPASLGGGA